VQKMKDDNFNDENLLNNDSFIRWVLYGENAVVWDKFMLLHPERKHDVIRASQVIKDLHQAEAEASFSVDEKHVWARIATTLKEDTQSVNAVTSASEKGKKYRYLAALALFVLAIFVVRHLYLLDRQITYKDLVAHAESTDQLEEVSSKDAASLKVKLPDGSTVTLGRNSKLSYPKQFEKEKRVVFMSGDAFFEVTKDPFRPFYVYANETVTKVLGTSFRITAFDNDKKVTVNVRTGRVSVFKQSRIQTSDPETKGMVLLPNQKVTFDRENESLVKNLTEIPMPIVNEPVSEIKKFEEENISKVFAELERRYGINIIYDQDLMSKCIVSITLQNESLYDNLDVLCKTIEGDFYCHNIRCTLKKIC